MSETIERPAGIGHNSQVTEPMPTLAEQLDPGIYSDQLREEYAHHAKRRDERVAGFIRFVLGNTTLPRMARADLPQEAQRFDLIIATSEARVWPVQFDGAAWVDVPGPSFARTMLPTVHIPSAEVNAKAVTFVKQLKEDVKLIEKDRKAIADVLNDAVKVIQLVFKAEIQDVLVEVSKGIEQGPLTQYTRRLVAEETARRQAEAARLKEEADRALAAAQRAGTSDMVENALQAGDDADRAMARAAAPVADKGRSRGNLGGVASVTTTWRYRITDRTAIPAEYWVLDEAKLAADVRRLKNTVAIPGVEQYSEIGSKVT